MRNLFHKVRQEKKCTFIADDVECGAEFVGSPNRRYCDKCTPIYRLRMRKVWVKQAQINAKVRGAA